MNEIWDGQAAACRGKTDVFFSDQPGDIEQAKRICVTCSLIKPCLEYALTNRVEHGVWGGEPFRNDPPVSVQIAKAWQEAEELGFASLGRWVRGWARRYSDDTGPKAILGRWVRCWARRYSDATRRKAIPIFITSDGDGHIRDFLEDAMRRRSGDDGASLGEGGGQLFRNRIQAVKRRCIQAVKRRWSRLSKAVQAARQLTKEG